MIGKTMNELNVGDAAEFSKTVSEADVYLFAGITGDLNPAPYTFDRNSISWHRCGSGTPSRPGSRS